MDIIIYISEKYLFVTHGVCVMQHPCFADFKLNFSSTTTY